MTKVSIIYENNKNILQKISTCHINLLGFFCKITVFSGNCWKFFPRFIGKFLKIFWKIFWKFFVLGRGRYPQRVAPHQFHCGGPPPALVQPKWISSFTLVWVKSFLLALCWHSHRASVCKSAHSSIAKLPTPSSPASSQMPKTTRPSLHSPQN